MKEYKSNEDLIKYLISKNVVVKNEQDAINKIEKYTYYSVVNSYKNNISGNNNRLQSQISSSSTILKCAMPPSTSL